MLRAGVLLGLIAASAALSGCGTVIARAHPGRLQVAAAENIWGSIAAQLGGQRVQVTSVIADPATDPHSYEPVAADAIAFSRAQLAIVNGIGYDPWARRLIDAGAAGRRQVIDVGRVRRLDEGANPHQWYDPASVTAVAERIAAAYARLRPDAAGYFAARRSAFLNESLAAYRSLIAAIRRRFTGVRIGYSESIFAPMGRALGLRLITPASFARAVAEGSDVTARDVATVEAQVRRHAIRVWVCNTQNITPEVAHVNELARRAGIRVVPVTETLAPASASFQDWQVGQLRALVAALHAGTGR